jgi:alpha-soluble NSF attachment protein
MEGYKNKDLTFGSSREYKYLGALANAVEESKEEEFLAATAEFDQIVKLDKLKVKTLLKIRSRIEEEPSIL